MHSRTILCSLTLSSLLITSCGTLKQESANGTGSEEERDFLSGSQNVSKEEKRREELPKIICWGDSLTAMGGWTETLADLSGCEVYNAGTGAENARTIMARQGGDVMQINNITIPEECEPITIAIRAIDGGISTEAGKKVLPFNAKHLNPVRIGDVEGTLKWTGKNHADMDGAWTFTRSQPGSEIAITRPMAIRTCFDRIHNSDRNSIMIIFMGTNGGYGDCEELIDMHRKMIDHFKGKDYLVLGLSTGSAESRVKYEADMKKAFGRRFISLREYLAAPVYSNNEIVSCYGLEDQGLAPGELEFKGKTYVALEEIANGEVPHQILADGLHYTEGTKTVIGKLVYRKMRELNMLPDAPEGGSRKHP